MELWSCPSCGSKNAGEVCWKDGTPRPAAADAAPSAPDMSASAAAVPHRPATPSWSQPLAAGEAAPAPPPAAEPAAPVVPAAAAPTGPAPWSPPSVPSPPPTPAYSAPQTSSTGASWSAPASAAAPTPAPSAPPPPPAPSSAAKVPPLPTARILIIAAVLLVVLVVVLIVTLSHRGTSLTTPASIEGLPQIHGSNVDALAQQARRNAGVDGDGMLVGVYGNSEIPSFIFVVVKSKGNSLSSFEQGFMRGASQVGFSPSDLQKRSKDGVSYDCGTVQVTVGVPLSFCFFDDGSATGAGLVPREPGIDRALQLTSSGRGASESG